MTQLLTVSEVAERLQCSAGHIYNLIKRGDLNARRLGRTMLRVHQSDLDEFIESSSLSSNSTPQANVAKTSTPPVPKVSLPSVPRPLRIPR